MNDRTVVAIIVVLFLAILGAGYYFANQTPLPTPAPNPNPVPPNPPPPSPNPPPVPVPPPPQEVCDPMLWNHVYHPSRLYKVADCKTVTGVVEVVRKERDGDLHILLRPDPEFANLTNSANQGQELGDLVLEPVCEHPPVQQDAISACQGFTNKVTIPKVGDRIRASGSYVLDTAHGNWAELHPVTKIEIIGSGIVRPEAAGLAPIEDEAP